MMYEEDILNGLNILIEKSQSIHSVITDPTVYNGEYQIKEDILNISKKRKLAWFEPEDGVYIFNLNYLNHFKKYFNSTKKLHQELIDCGYDVISKRFRVVESTKLIEFKHQKQPTHIAIVTMFSDKAAVGYWQEFLKQVEIPDGVTVDVVMGDNSDNTNIKQLHLDVQNIFKNKFNEYYIIELGDPYKIQPNEHYLNPNKHIHVANTYSKLLTQVVNYYDYILKIEDDMGPPSDGFKKLYKYMKDFERQKRKVACVAGHYKQKFDPTTICVSMQPEIWGKIPKITEMQPRLFRVEMQGGGFALYSTKALREVLPYRLTFKLPNGNYYMTGWDGTIGEEWSNSGWEQYCDGGMYCEHYF